LSALEGWSVNETEISRPDGKFFRIIGVDVAISNREVQSWQQPMVQPAQSGLCGLIGKVIDGIMHFAVQAKVECGNRDIVELAPTVQCLTGDYRLSGNEPVPFLNELLDATEDMKIHDSMQSEEGGRFYYEENRNLIVIVGEELSDTLPPNFIWMTIWQLMYFNQFNNYAF
jgi:oxidase EvaA